MGIVLKPAAHLPGPEATQVSHSESHPCRGPGPGLPAGGLQATPTSATCGSGAFRGASSMRQDRKARCREEERGGRAEVEWGQLGRTVTLQAWEEPRSSRTSSGPWWRGCVTSASRRSLHSWQPIWGPHCTGGLWSPKSVAATTEPGFNSSANHKLRSPPQVPTEGPGRQDSPLQPTRRLRLVLTHLRAQQRRGVGPGPLTSSPSSPRWRGTWSRLHGEGTCVTRL